MSELYDKSIIKLELDQVLSMLADHAQSHEGKQACLMLRPSTDLEEVRLLLDETTAASELSMHKGYPGFSGVVDVDASLERAERGGCLQPKELLQIAAVLRCARNVKAYTSQDEKPTVLNPFFLTLVPNKYFPSYTALAFKAGYT